MTRPPNRERRVLDYFLDHEGQPVNTFILERIGGRRGWRTAVSGARAMARTLRRDIRNQQRRVYKGGRLQYVTSTYTLVKVRSDSKSVTNGSRVDRSPAHGLTVTDWLRLNTRQRKPPALFAEWMMGFPAQWTALPSAEIASCRRTRSGSRAASSRRNR